MVYYSKNQVIIEIIIDEIYLTHGNIWKKKQGPAIKAFGHGTPTIGGPV
jgi:hypothetical protein